GVDGSNSQSLSFSHNSSWVWKSVSLTISKAGSHQINLWMRDDGAYVDRVLLAKSSSYTPSGKGPPESLPGVNITYPAPGATFPAGTALLVKAGVKDATNKTVRFYVDGVLMATDTSAPFSFVATWLAVGNHLLTAVSSDTQGHTETSQGVAITITPPAT